MIETTFIFSESAKRDGRNIYHYIKEEFGEIYAIKFREQLLIFLQYLAKHSNTGRPSKNNKHYRVYIFKKANKIVYSVMGNFILIIRILSQKMKLSGNY